MFIALSHCYKIKKREHLNVVYFPFKGMAFGQKIDWIEAIYDRKKYEFKFKKNNEYIIYLEKTEIKNKSLIGKIIYYQVLDKVRVK